MKVICRKESLYGIEDPDVLNRLEGYINFPDGEFGLVLDREYTVYGIVFWDNAPLVYVFLDEMDDYPIPVAIEFFEVSDVGLSKYWMLSCSSKGAKESSSSLVFREWAEDPAFYERLIDGDEVAVDIFKKYRLLMDSEMSPNH